MRGKNKRWAAGQNTNLQSKVKSDTTRVLTDQNTIILYFKVTINLFKMTRNLQVSQLQFSYKLCKSLYFNITNAPIRSLIANGYNTIMKIVVICTNYYHVAIKVRNKCYNLSETSNEVRRKCVRQLNSIKMACLLIKHIAENP